MLDISSSLFKIGHFRFSVAILRLSRGSSRFFLFLLSFFLFLQLVAAIHSVKDLFGCHFCSTFPLHTFAAFCFDVSVFDNLLYNNRCYSCALSYDILILQGEGGQVRQTILSMQIFLRFPKNIQKKKTELVRNQKRQP